MGVGVIFPVQPVGIPESHLKIDNIYIYIYIYKLDLEYMYLVVPALT